MSVDVLRIAVVLGEMGTGGIEQGVMNYYRHIDHRRDQFDFYVHEDSKNILKDEIETLGETVKYSQVRRQQNRRARLRRIRQWRLGLGK